MIRGSPAGGTARHATPVPAMRLTPQPSESAPAWDVTASSASQTSAAPIAADAAQSRSAAPGSAGAVVRPSTARSMTIAEPPAAVTATATPDGVALERLTPAALDLAPSEWRRRMPDWPPSTPRTRVTRSPRLADGNAAPAMSALSWYRSPR